jgi:HD-GYP domain-containing protein (c-di-GMP phosphodiesterase class II)
MPVDVAVAELLANAGSQLDPTVVEALVAIIGDGLGEDPSVFDRSGSEGSER